VARDASVSPLSWISRPASETSFDQRSIGGASVTMISSRVIFPALLPGARTENRSTTWETKVSLHAVQYFFRGDPLVAGNVIVAAADRATGASIHAFDNEPADRRSRFPTCEPAIYSNVVHRRVPEACLTVQTI
jgi:hypothetical protein